METKLGYRFAGWYVDKERTKRINPGGRLISTTHLYPKWEVVQYPVHYILNGGTNSRKNPRLVNIHSGILKLYPARCPGKFFDGWYMDGKRMEFLPEGIARSVTLEARFKDIPVIRFETYGGGRIAPRELNEEGKLMPFRSSPYRMGYDFVGWYLDEQFRVPFDFSMSLPGSCTLYARWSRTVYLLRLDPNGGWVPRGFPTYYHYDSGSILLPVPVRRGYTFEGWMDSYGKIRKLIPAGSMGDVVLQAVWSKKEFEVHH